MKLLSLVADTPWFFVEVRQWPGLKLWPSPRFSLSFSQFSGSCVFLLISPWGRALMWNIHTINPEAAAAGRLPVNLSWLKILYSRIVLFSHTWHHSFLPHHLPCILQDSAAELNIRHAVIKEWLKLYKIKSFSPLSFCLFFSRQLY